MSHALHVMLATAELYDFDFFAPAMRLDGCSHFTAFKQRGTNLDVFAFAHHQDLVKIDGIALIDIQRLNPQGISLGDAILLTACLYNCIHFKNSNYICCIVEKGRSF